MYVLTFIYVTLDVCAHMHMHIQLQPYAQTHIHMSQIAFAKTD